MPIKPENKKRYPENWKQIRTEILERAKNKCEQCNAENHSRIMRGTGDDAGTYMTEDAEVFCAETGDLLGRIRMCDYTAKKAITVVLTIAHLDHTPENCDPSNLRAWCQRCHLDYDKHHHAINAAATRKSRLAIGDLFA